ncbi:hypothetical protein B0H10DRAFT_1997416 [Mycena sp. CBHHK59/15]|nr:hypothetical protein B0H10DRAFT_1997416 [Mycena sp. CBHHK59/15]
MSLSADDIQRHLYASFLHARTPDVALRVKGAWHAIYRLHRVVLIQAASPLGFFNSLFTAGFAESSPQPDEIDIIFDDANITRAGALRFCIAHLYGGGPPLHIFPSLVPSTSQPLTSAFPFTSVDRHPATPPTHQPGTPRFLLSLLATSVYLSIPALAAKALSSILSTVGPYTVLQYLNFALGKPIGPPDPVWGEPDAAVGLEHVAQLIPDETVVFPPSEKSSASVDSKDDDASLSSSDTAGTDDRVPENQFHYGAISDKIGEAAACWLARWGPDMLSFEELKAGSTTQAPTLTFLSRRRAKTMSDSVVPVTAAPADYSAVPTIWDRGGLSVKWICAVVSADTLCVRGERERYDFARSVVELRRRHGIFQEEEDGWVRLFKQGVYYCHMSMEDVIHISKDSSPTTKQPFVSIAVLQAAHWQNSIWRQEVAARPSPSSPPSLDTQVRPAPAPTPGSPVQREKELGITQTTAEISARLSASDPTLDKMGPYYLVPGDSSQRIGDNGGSVNPPPAGGSAPPTLSMDELFTTSFTPSSPASPTMAKPPTAAPTPLSRASAGEANFFGIQSMRYTAAGCVAADPGGKARWSPYPPFRFSVEFWDLEALKEKARLYSHTVWYGGSFFNAYVQVVRKKGTVQLGIYLHRQSTLDVPGASAPPGVREPRERHASLVHTRGPSLPAIVSPPSPAPTHYSPSIHPSHPPTRSTTPVSVAASLPSMGSSPPSGLLAGTGGNTHPATAAPVPPAAPYRDPRPAVTAYFTISCASATGASQTRFASAPDVFCVSQSWGWKSSSLRTEEYMDVVAAADEGVPRGRQLSLRACVVLGLV